MENRAQSPNEFKSKTTAGLLALFLGGVGIHKFYLGQTGWGIAYLLFCWTLVPGVVALIEALIYFSMSGQDFDYKYNRIARPKAQQKLDGSPYKPDKQKQIWEPK